VIENQAPRSRLKGDPEYLKMAFDFILFVIRRELVTSTQLHVRLRRIELNGARMFWIALAGGEDIDAVDRTSLSDLGPFDVKRGGCGLKPPIADWIITAHGGRICAPVEYPKSAAVLVLPEAGSAS
jgi:hypothetical protein